MDPTRINWSRRHASLLSESSSIPPDITFKFLEAGDDSVSAHKMILALASPVFMKMLFVHNTLDKYATEIVLEHTTKPALQIMIDAIYDVVPMEKSLQGKSVDEVFAVLYLVHKYEIPEFELAVQNFLSTFPLTEDTVLDVAENAMDYLTTFEEEAIQLLLSCAQFLSAKLNDFEFSLRLLAEIDNGERMKIIKMLMVITGDVDPRPLLNDNQDLDGSGIIDFDDSDNGTESIFKESETSLSDLKKDLIFDHSVYSDTTTRCSKSSASSSNTSLAISPSSATAFASVSTPPNTSAKVKRKRLGLETFKNLQRVI